MRCLPFILANQASALPGNAGFSSFKLPAFSCSGDAMDPKVRAAASRSQRTDEATTMSTLAKYEIFHCNKFMWIN